MPQLHRDVYVVDDDPAICGTISSLLSARGYHVTCFANGNSFLIAARKRIPDCIIIEMFLTKQSGIKLLDKLNRETIYPAPIIIMSGRGDISLAVSAVKRGAHHFIEKPFSDSDLIEQVESASRNFSDTRDRFVRLSSLKPLTRREKEILPLLQDGRSAKDIALIIGISHRTVEYHRGTLYKKFDVNSVVDLVRRSLPSLSAAN